MVSEGHDVATKWLESMEKFSPRTSLPSGIAWARKLTQRIGNLAHLSAVFGAAVDWSVFSKPPNADRQ